MARPKQNDIPPRSWWDRMDKLYAEKYAREIRLELNARQDLINLLDKKLLSFTIWAGKERLSHKANLEEEVDDYINKRFGNDYKRMYNINVKEWYRRIKIVFERDNYTCQYCGKKGGKLEADHIIPFSKGGSDEIDNLITSCRKCNRQKKDKTADEFLEWKKLKHI